MTTLATVVVLAVVLWGVVRRPWGLPEAAFAVPGALVVLVSGLETWAEARGAFQELWPTLAFLAGVLVLAEVAEAAGLFDAAGSLLAGLGRGSGAALVTAVAGLAVVVTSILSLDATIVLFTPVVIRLVSGRGRAVADAGLLVTVLLANGGSLLVPVANLTNLLVVQQTGLGFGTFTLRMFLPGVVSIVVITLVCRRLAGRADGAPVDAPVPVAAPALEEPSAVAPLDRIGMAVVAGMGVVLVGFFVASTVSVAPAWVAAAGAVVLGGVVVAGRRARAVTLARSVNSGFLVFVVGLVVVVDAVSRHGVGHWLTDLVPSGDTLGAMALMAVVAAVAANLVNNLPATLLLLPALHGRPVALVLAALLGLNIGPNLFYQGSLATLLWRRITRGAGIEPAPATYFRTTAVATPLALAGSVFTLWLATRVV